MSDVTNEARAALQDAWDKTHSLPPLIFTEAEADAIIAATSAARIASLEAEVAGLRELLADAGEILETASRPAHVDPDRHFSEQVKELGELGGYGALMATASALWRESLGDLAGGEFAAGPCVVTAANSVARIRQALTEPRT